MLDVVIVLVSIAFGILIGRYVFPFVGKEIAALHAKIDALLEQVKAKL